MLHLDVQQTAENLIAFSSIDSAKQPLRRQSHCPESLQAVEFRGNDIIVVIIARL